MGSLFSYAPPATHLIFKGQIEDTNPEPVHSRDVLSVIWNVQRRGERTGQYWGATHICWELYICQVMYMYMYVCVCVLI